MWCPVGYVAFSDALAQIEDLAFFAYLKLTGQKDDQSVFRLAQAEEMVRSGLVEDGRNAALVRELMVEMLLARLIESWPPLACSAGGNLMRVDDVFFTHADRLDWIYINWPMDKMSEFSSYMTYHTDGNFTGLSVRRRYCFIDAEHGMICIKNNSATLFEGASPNMGETGDKMVAIVKNFAGWALCWKEEDLPKSHELLERTFPAKDTSDFWRLACDAQPADSQRGDELVLSMVLQAYPDGKSASWEEVCRRVGYSRRSIERALAATGRKDWKYQGAQE